VANLATTPELGFEELHKILAARDGFHVMLVRGEDLKVEGKSSSRLIVVFTSPPKKEMWRRSEGTCPSPYVWRTSVVQLEPEFAVADSGGMSVSVEGDVLKLRSHGEAAKQGTSMKIDLGGRVVDVEGLGVGLAENAENKSVAGSSGPTTRVVMQLTDLKCYRMPGVSSTVTRSG
jgi:hypothetical protein